MISESVRIIFDGRVIADCDGREKAEHIVNLLLAIEQMRRPFHVIQWSLQERSGTT